MPVLTANSALSVIPFGGGDGDIFRFDLDLSVFTEALAIRGDTDVFYAFPIQGDWDGTGVPDLLTYPRGALLGNQTQNTYANFDPYQGSIVFWITPEWDGNDGLAHYVFFNNIHLYGDRDRHCCF